MTDAPDPVIAGTNLAYALQAASNGPSDAQMVALSTTVPAGTTFVSLTAPAGWNCTAPAIGSAGAVSCTRAALSAGAAGQLFTLTVKVNANAPAGSIVSNTAAISAQTTDPNSANNTAAASGDREHGG